MFFLLTSGWYSAILAHFILKEKLQKMGVLGCVLCIVGSTVIVLHAPEEKTPTSVEQIWGLATQPGIVWWLVLKLILLRYRFFGLMRFLYSINDLAGFIYFLLILLDLFISY